MINDRLLDKCAVAIDQMCMASVYSGLAVVIRMEGFDVRGELLNEVINMIEDQKLDNLNL